MAEWIDPKDQLPPTGQLVIVLCKFKKLDGMKPMIYVGYLRNIPDDWCIFSGYRTAPDALVLYWCEIPQPPIDTVTGY